MREWSEALSVSEQVEPQTLAGKSAMVCELVMGVIRIPNGWTEVKVGCIYRDYPQCGSEATPSARVPSIRYVASGNNAEHFGKELFA